MSAAPSASERWLRLLLRLYPADFRDEMGEALVETYRDRCRAAAARGGRLAVAWIWLRALVDSLRNGVGERLRPGIAWRRSGNWGRDAERVLRRLARAPAFTLSIVATLTVGLGAFAVVYTVVDTVLIEPLPYARPNDLYFVWRDYTWIDLRRGWLGGTDVAEMQRAGGVIQAAVGLRRTEATLAPPDGAAGEPDQVAVMATSPNLFAVLGVRPLLGRGFAPDEVGPGRANVAVLGYDLWQRRFGGDRRVVGTDVRLDGERVRVIGVMPRDFHFVRHASLGAPEPADLWVPLAVNLAETNPKAGSYAGLVRVRPGTRPDAVRAAIDALARTIDRRDFDGRGLRLVPVGVKADLVAGVRPALVVLGAAGVLLVVVLTVNLASLLLVRAAQRDREFAITRALGANRVALVRATLLEAMTLGAGGGTCGALAAVWGTRALVALAPADLPRRDAVGVDWRIALVVVAVGAFLGLAAGALPAIWATRSTLSSLLRDAGVRGGGGGGGRLRRSMVVVQVALSLVLLSAGGLVARSFERLLRAYPGFDASGVLTLQVPVGRDRYPTPAAANAVHGRIERALAAIPGVRSVGSASTLPLTASTDQLSVALPGAPGNTGDRDHDTPLVDFVMTRPGYVETLRIPVRAGRTFAAAHSAATHEVLIDRTLAREFFPGRDAVGARLLAGTDTLTVIGVVEHARMYDVHKDGRAQVYGRNDEGGYASLYYALRTDRDPASLVPDVQRAVRAVDPQLPVAQLRTMDDIVGEAVRQPRLTAVLLAGFSFGALLLAAMGLFGVVAGSVSRRRHELAVRLALGAERQSVLWLVLREGARLILLGLVIGIPGVYLAGRTIAGTLVGVSPFDPPTLAVVALGLAAVALGACYVPARRVGGIEPARSLREG